MLGENLIKHLSMGMSNDFEIAIEEGSTQIRLEQSCLVLEKRNRTFTVLK